MLHVGLPNLPFNQEESSNNLLHQSIYLIQLFDVDIDDEPKIIKGCLLY